MLEMRFRRGPLAWLFSARAAFLPPALRSAWLIRDAALEGTSYTTTTPATAECEQPPLHHVHSAEMGHRSGCKGIVCHGPPRRLALQQGPEQAGLAFALALKIKHVLDIGILGNRVRSGSSL